MSVHDLSDAAAELLTTCAAILTAAGLEPPARQYVSPGEPSLDCDTLAVHVERVGERSPAAEGASRAQLSRHVSTNEVLLVVTVARCIPSAEAPPPPAALTGVAVALNADGWALWAGLTNRARAGTLLLRGCRKPQPGDLVPLAPSGGVAGYLVRVSADLDVDGAL